MTVSSKSPAEVAGVDGLEGQYLSFTLGREDYGVDILRVREIKGWEPVRTLPDMPECIKGVLDLRGTIVPIIDLRTRFQLEQAEFTPTTVTIVLTVQMEDKEQVMGIVVDSVSDVLDVTADELKPAPNMGLCISSRFIRGMVTRDERMVVLLDVDGLMNPDELGLLEEIS